MAFSVLFICTGNICRSPVAEKLFRARMADDSDVDERSREEHSVDERSREEPCVDERSREEHSADERSREEPCVLVSSAGTAGLTGHALDRPSALALSELGVDPAGHYARRVDGPMLRAADLVLTATAEQRAVLLQAEPSMMAKVFTLREFGRLARSVPQLAPAHRPDADALRARVQQIADCRGSAEAPIGGADNIADPFGASLDVARRTVAQVSAAVDDALVALHLR